MLNVEFESVQQPLKGAWWHGDHRSWHEGWQWAKGSQKYVVCNSQILKQVSLKQVARLGATRLTE